MSACMVYDRLPSPPPPRYSLQQPGPTILFDPPSPVPYGGMRPQCLTAPSTLLDLDPKFPLLTPENKTAVGTVCVKLVPRMSAIELRLAPVLTIVGIKIQSTLANFVPLGRLVEAGVLVRDRMDAVNLVFRDEAARKKAFRILETRPEAQQILDEFAQYQSYYVAWRPTADIAFLNLESLNEPVFDERRRIYLQDVFKPPGYEFGPTGSIELPAPTSLVEHDPTLMEITSISAFFASEYTTTFKRGIEENGN
ncbi:hypothetical protein JCM16303_002449 [Sporobolomyces ruberrimus]